MPRKASVEAFLKAETSSAKLPDYDFVFENMLYREYRLYAFHGNHDPVGIEAFRNAVAKAGIERQEVECPQGIHWTWNIDEWDEELYSGKTFHHRQRTPVGQFHEGGPLPVYPIRLNERRSWVKARTVHEHTRKLPVVVRQLKVLEDVHYVGDTLKAGTIVDQLAKRKSEEYRNDADEVIIDWRGVRRWIDARIVCLAQG